MGEEAAAVTIAAILERQEQITSPGGYLRTLTERKRAGTTPSDPFCRPSIVLASRSSTQAAFRPRRRALSPVRVLSGHDAGDR